ncbi:U3 small nucleolar RNA-associated protein 6 homolog isoform X1 [Hydra vulgaris]|uniref:U3 small nucleolar RNA-associated protein 6 homolog n=1 Tax=Hydra vulgaris TaxID=6087 RepID=T2M4Q2_HYDVU|nr:U3 small nucleolar RNA-associated protein 6 homolog [Hydra vulgaris]
MAEVVFEKLESMLPELEELGKEEVFSKEEIKNIIKRRTDFEYKLQKRIVEKKDILNYLEYEMKLDKLRQIRSKRLKLKFHNPASLSISRRLHLLFQKGLMKFGNDLQLWLQYIEFCKLNKSTHAISLTFGKLLQQHGKNPEVWLLAANHEFETAKNVDNARMLLQRGLRMNKTSEKLWQEYFRMELLHVEKIKKRRKLLGIEGTITKHTNEEEPEMIEDFLANKTAEIVFQNAVKQISDVNFCLSFLSISQEFDDTENLQQLILQSTLALFPTSEIMLDTIAKQSLVMLQKKRNEEFVKDNDWIKVEDEVQQKYEEAVQKVNTSLMWEKYVRTFTKLLNESRNQAEAKRRYLILQKIFGKAEEQNQASIDLYLVWAELFIDVGETQQALTTLSRALSLHKMSSRLWVKYLLVKCSLGDEWEVLQKEFKRALNLVSKDSVPIWQMYIDLAVSSNAPETKTIFEDCLKSSNETKKMFSVQYIKWVDQIEGSKAFRKLSLRMMSDASMDFLKECIQIESKKDAPNIKYIRSIYQKMAHEYGKNSLDVWLDYINFEKQSNSENIQRITDIYLQAKRTLDGNLVADFIAKYTLESMPSSNS